MQSTPIFRISSAECLLSGVACLDYSGHRIILTQQNRWCQWAELGVSSRLGGGELLGKLKANMNQCCSLISEGCLPLL